VVPERQPSTTDNTSANTTNGGTTDVSDQVTPSGAPAQQFPETLLGPSKVQWGAKAGEPAELDFSTDGGDNPFSSKYNSLLADKSLFDDPFGKPYNELTPRDGNSSDANNGPRQQLAPDDTPRAVKPAEGDNTTPKLLETIVTPNNPAGEGGAKKDGTPQPAKKEPGTDALSSTIIGAAKEIGKAPEAIANAFNPKNVAKVFDGLFSGDQEAARIVKNAERGKQNLDAQDAQYIKQWHGPGDNGKIAPPAEGDDPAKYTHKNADGSSYDVTDGKISAFTTAPTADNPNGITYKDITYDKNNQVTSYTTPFNQKHMRTSTPNKDGIADWQSTTLDGKKFSPYGGANASTWRGKPVVDDKGFHNLVTTGTHAGNMYSRNMDGSHTMTKPEYKNGAMTGLTSTATLADNTEVSRKGTFDKAGKLHQDNSNISVDEADGPKVSKVGFDETGKGKVIPPPKPDADMAGNGESAITMFDNLLSNGTDMLKSVESLDIVRTGKNNFSVSGDLADVYMPPPNVTVGGFGPFGGVSATPQGGTVDKFSMQLSFDDRTVRADHIRGLNGTASLTRTGLFGKTKHIGSTATSTTGMEWDTATNTMIAKSPQRDTPLDANNFSRDSFNGKLLSDEKAEAKAKETLKSLDKHLNSAHIRQTSQGVFEGSLDLKENRMPIGKKIPGVETNLYMDDKIDFKLNKDGISFKPGEVQLGVQIGNGLEDRKSVSSIEPGTDEKGNRVMKIKFHGQKEAMTLAVPPPGDRGNAPGGDAKPSQAKTTRTGQDASRDAMPRPNTSMERAAAPVRQAETHYRPAGNVHCEPQQHHRRGRRR
jgi:hypothetical protein